jgi:hypothetical protein
MMPFNYECCQPDFDYATGQYVHTSDCTGPQDPFLISEESFPMNPLEPPPRFGR